MTPLKMAEDGRMSQATFVSERYRLAPQMRVYDALPTVIAPYITFCSRPNFRSSIVNTDGQGFRHSTSRDGVVDSRSWWQQERRGIVLGGSFAFGVGATQDRHTIASLLTGMTRYTFLNLAIRAGNSTQEVIAAIPFLAESACIVICSGMNTLLFNIQSICKNDLYGPFASEEILADLAAHSLDDLARLTQRRSRAAGLRAPAWLRGTLGRLAPLRRRPAGRAETHAEGSAVAGDPTAAVEAALRLQKRDVAILVRAIPPRTKLLFAAQPFGETTRKELCPEERQLFDLTDRYQGPSWQAVKRLLAEQWPTYVARLQEICAAEGIGFVELDTVDLRGWSYVDRVHMTDIGYAQIAERLAAELE